VDNGKNYTFISRDLKQSERNGTQFHCHRNSVYVQTDSCTLGNTISDDRFIGFCSNRADGHKTTSYKEFGTFYIRVLKGKYFQHKNECYQPLNGLAMGSPISSLVAEHFLLHFEHSVFTHNIDNKSVILESRYFDDLLIIYGNITIIFTMPKELNNSTK